MDPSRLGRYEILAEIGRGAMGRVYRALDPMVGREVAIKTLQFDEFPTYQRAEILRRFRREAQAAGQLSHPHIVTIFDVGESFFVMELVKGETLQSYVARKGRLDPKEMLELVAPLAAALDYAHQRGVVHRDVKPSNIMVTSRGIPKLMDFGLAHLEATALTRAGQSLGSPAYMAPEQIQGLEPTPRADLYSLAVVSYELLTGARPFAGKNITTLLHQVVHQAPRPPRFFNASLPPRYDELFERALSKNPEERFPDASSFVTDLNLKELEAMVSLLEGPPRSKAEPLPASPSLEEETMTLPRTPTTSATERRPKTRFGARERRLLLGGALSCLVLLGGAGLLLWSFLPYPIPLRIESSPPGARVWLDGRELGVTPLTVEGAPRGDHELTAAMDGFLPAKERLTLEPGASPAPVVFALQPARASLSLVSTPSPSSVLVDGDSVGNTPLSDLELAPGPHRIEVKKQGFEPFRSDVEARPGETLHLVARLKPRAAPRSAARTIPAPAKEPELPAIAQLGDPGVSPPQKLAGEFSRYPEPALRRRLSGTVTVEMVISDTGIPSELRVIESAGPILDDAVLRAVERWRFTPATRDGRPVKIRWRVRQHFRLEGTSGSLDS